ncbi:Uncharacterized protein HZ326_19416 [Fusarium oxysporum f. sp. albedinis]|nr:Uncharacterized protein HZ326_28604 [Fusarium oxysporum f. sp. albedinis]KAJ0137608.1 Uncharacterized protein HZ326_19416 [Fusarium oxysporum f. sp. albedinis]
MLITCYATSDILQAGPPTLDGVNTLSAAASWGTGLAACPAELEAFPVRCGALADEMSVEGGTRAVQGSDQLPKLRQFLSEMAGILSILCAKRQRNHEFTDTVKALIMQAVESRKSYRAIAQEARYSP